MELLDFDKKAYVNKFDVGREYNKRAEKGDFLGFYKWLISLVSQGLKNIISLMIENLREGSQLAKIAEMKGHFSKDKGKLPDSAKNEYPNAHPEEFKEQTDRIFKAVGMADNRYLDPEYINRAILIDTIIDNYIKENGGKILNEKGKDITGKIRREAHKSIEVGKEMYSFRYRIKNVDFDVCILERSQAELLSSVLGINSFSEKAKDSVGDYLVFDMNDPEIRKAILDFELRREQPTVEPRKEAPEKPAEHSEDKKEKEPAREEKPKDMEKELPKEKAAEKTVDKPIDRVDVKVKHYEAQKQGDYKKFYFKKPENRPVNTKEQHDWKAIQEGNRKILDEVLGKAGDKDEVFVKIIAASKMVKDDNLIKIPAATENPPKGISNKGKLELFIKVKDNKELGRKNSTIEKRGNDSRSIILSLKDDIEICTADGKPVPGKSAIPVKDILTNFAIQEYLINPSRMEPMPEAYIAEPVKSDAKEAVFDEKTTKIGAGTIKDNPMLTEIDLNHSKAFVKTGAFKNLSSEIRLKNAENATFDKNAFENCSKIVFVEPEIVSDNRDAIMADLKSKAAAIGASVVSKEAPERVINIPQEVLDVELISEYDQMMCEEAERELEEQNQAYMDEYYRELYENPPEQESEKEPEEMAGYINGKPILMCFNGGNALITVFDPATGKSDRLTGDRTAFKEWELKYKKSRDFVPGDVEQVRGEILQGVSNQQINNSIDR